MIRILKERKKQRPYYTITFYYMIGDANGDTSEGAEVSIDNPYLERVLVLFNKLKSPPGHWGIILDNKALGLWKVHNMLSEEELELLNKIINYEDLDEAPEEDLRVFADCIRTGNEYTFLVFEGVVLHYIDEYGFEYETEIVNEN